MKMNRPSRNKILLNDLLQLDSVQSVKVRLLLYAGRNETGVRNTNFIEYVADKEKQHELMEGLFWNYSKRSYKEGDTVIGLAAIDKGIWLLFGICKVTKDLGVSNGVGYEYTMCVQEYGKYFGRVIVSFKNSSQNLIRRGEGIMQDLVVKRVLEDVYDSDIFPGYENVRLTWSQLSRVINKESWKTALENQKGVYLIVDTKTGKQYVGSAYGETMLLGRWQMYIKNGHGGNVELKKFDFKYIKAHFQYSILEIFKSKVDDHVIIDRESWWKRTLCSREFGYNKN